MKEFQKIIKYVAVAFGLYLAISIIGGIIAIIVSIFTGFYGISYLADSLNGAINSDDSSIERIDENQDVEEFSKMKLDISASNLTIKVEGNSYRVETYQIPKNTKIESKNGILEIKSNKKLNKNDSKSSIIIYLPEDVELEEADIQVGAGIMDITGLIAKNVEFSFGAGNVNMQNISVKNNAKIECGAGQTIIKDSELANADIEAGVGKLVYSGDLTGNTQISCGVGGVELELTGDAEKYAIHTEKGIGDIKINDSSVANDSTIGRGENKIDIEGGVGGVDIKTNRTEPVPTVPGTTL